MLLLVFAQISSRHRLPFHRLRLTLLLQSTASNCPLALPACDLALKLWARDALLQALPAHVTF